MVQDARKFKYSSDYPMPLVTYRNEFTLVAPQSAGSITVIKIAHGLPYMPLAIGKVSESKDFNVVQDITNNNATGALLMYVDDKQFYFVMFKRPEDVVTRYVRVIGFAPPDYDGEIDLIQNNTPYRLNSDDEYINLYAQGVLDSSTGGMVPHKLGYVPQCRAWQQTLFSSPGVEDILGFQIVQPSIIRYTNTGRLEYQSVATNDKFIAYGKDMDNNDYSLTAIDKIYYHIYTKEA